MLEKASIKVIKKMSEKSSILDACRITVIVEDTPAKEATLMYRHGLSLLIETTSENSKSKILFDTGPSPEILIYNVKALNLRLDDLNVVILSHGHYDHTDGLPAILKQVTQRLPVVMHPTSFNPKFAYKPNLTYIGQGFDRSLIEANGGVLVPTRAPITLINGIITSGEIPLENGFEMPKGFWKVEDDRFMEDLMVDEQALIIDLKTKGLVVVVGCAHRGIINTLRYAQRITNKEEIHALIGGFHLSKASDEAIYSTLRELKGIAPDHIYPCHCTGTKAIRRLTETFGERCKQLHTGDVIILR